MPLFRIPWAPGKRRPTFLGFRSSQRFITFVCAFSFLSDMAIYGIIVPVVPFRLRILGYTNVAQLTGYLLAAYGAALVASSPPLAYLGELTKHRQIGLLIALLWMLGSVLMFMFSKKFALMLVARLLQGFSGTAIWTLACALLADSVDEDQIGPAFGQAMIGFSVGNLIGAPVGGVLYKHGGYYAPFIFALALVGCDLVLRLSIVEHHVAYRYITPQGRKEKQPEKKDQHDRSPHKARHRTLIALKKFMVSKRSITCFLLTLLNGFVFGGLLDSSMTLYLNTRYGLDSQGAGLVFIAALAPSFISSPLAGFWVQKSGTRIPLLASCVSTVPFAGLLIVPQLPLAAFIVILCLFGATSTASLVPVISEFSLLPRQIPNLGYAHVYAIFNLSFSIGALIGPLVAGQILDALGNQRGWQVMAGISCGLILLVAWPLWATAPARSHSDDMVSNNELVPTAGAMPSSKATRHA